MAKVLIYKLENDGSQKVICTCVLENNSVKCDGDSGLVANLNSEGIINYAAETPEKVFPKDGKIFLENLSQNFNSGYFNATDIIEE
ncbi:MAG: hypothetical protein HYV90_02440 [Candidatus Woesebacteria bacterium]|nr:MAG: hypothetical protein HYV90_02440 [Candidatus Woesebacteria bacterium]